MIDEHTLHVPSCVPHVSSYMHQNTFECFYFSVFIPYFAKYFRQLIFKEEAVILFYPIKWDLGMIR